MRLRRVLVIAGALVWPQALLWAQPVGRVPRIGYLSNGSPVSGAHLQDAFRQGLRELGWHEGRNVAIEYRFAEGHADRIATQAAQLVAERVDVMVAMPAAGAVAARKATTSIPIVAVSVADPVRLGLAASLAQPGGNLTGLSFSVGLESITKALQLLREVIPAASRIAVLTNPNNPAQAVAVADIENAGRALGLQLQFMRAGNAAEIDSAFAAMARERVTALFVAPESQFVLHRERLAALTAQHRLPSMHGVRENVDAGGLLSYGPSLSAQARRAAAYVDKILKGARPGELPIEQPTKFELVINLKTAKALGIVMPQSLLLRADEVIE